MIKNCTIIAAIGKNKELGYKNTLLWKLKDDMKRFKDLTTGNIVIMGRKTYESMNSRPLPNRENIVLSKTLINAEENKGVKIFDSLDLLTKHIKNIEDKKIFVIGGEQIYKLFLSLANMIELTRVDDSPKLVDAYFPETNWSDWVLTKKEDREMDERNEKKFSFETYIKKI